MNPAPLDDVSDSLPPRLREHLTRELDPGEKLLWCGRPDPARRFRRIVSPVLFFAAITGSLSASMLYGARETWLTLHDPQFPFNLRSPQIPDSKDVWTLGAFGVLLFLVLCLIISLPWLEAARARRTVYALTPTRILTIHTSRRGLPRVEALEPGHPLHLLRQDYAGGRGDILVYPTGRGTRATLTLTGIDNARAVERLIRATFDPPAPKA